MRAVERAIKLRSDIPVPLFRCHLPYLSEGRLTGMLTRMSRTPKFLIDHPEKSTHSSTFATVRSQSPVRAVFISATARPAIPGYGRKWPPRHLAQKVLSDRPADPRVPPVNNAIYR